jgi:Rod binding domain-containing protein
MDVTSRFSGLPLVRTNASADGLPLKREVAVADNKDDTRQQRLRKACTDFEGMMLGELLKTMRQTEGDDSGILPTGRAERIFINQQCEALGDVLAQREPLGLGRMLYTAASANLAASTTQAGHSTGGGTHEDHGTSD